MPALARGQASNCANPTIDVFTSVNGVLTDVAVLEFQIFDVSDAAKQITPVQVFPTLVGTREPVTVAVLCPAVGAGKISTGRFVATYTPPLSEPLGTHRVRWFFKLTLASPEQSFQEEFEVLPELTATGESGYALVADVRAEGVTTTMATDQQVFAAIARASRFIDRATGQFFEPRTRVYHLDGTGTPTLFLDTPVIAVSEVLEDDEPVDATELKVYARVISEQLLAPDDRMNPRLEFWANGSASRTREVDRRRWRPGQQNIQVSGVFGYTDPDPPSMTGKTPELIRRLCVLMVLRDYAPRLSAASRDALLASSVLEERTRDQSVKYGGRRALMASGSFGATPWTDDPEVNVLLDMYRCTPVVRTTT